MFPMKKILSLFAALALAAIALAQTPEEIVTRMDAEIDKYENDGFSMLNIVKVPVIGTIKSKAYTLGDKMRMDSEVKGVKVIVWMDNDNEWTYNSKNNEVEIKKADPKKREAEDDMEMFDGLTEGYDVTIASETDKAWELLCKKNKANKDKDAPKKITITVSKGTYLPISLTTKMSGLTITMQDIHFGVTDKQVTFNADDFPGITIVDKR
jgi:outer membrane lipoprotein-sorting protein